MDNQEAVLKQNLKQTITHQLIMLYSISKYHEKYHFTQWVLDELLQRGLSKKDVDGFDEHFSKLYDRLINSETL